MDEVFRALADPTRRQLLDRLNIADGQTLTELSAGLAMSRQAVTKHLGVLEAANLITPLRQGREKHHYLNAVPINAIADRWITQYDRARVRALDDLKTALETADMPTAHDVAFVYTTYIKATAAQVYDALTKPEFTERYWGLAFESVWTTGAAMTWLQDGIRIEHPDQVVLEADRPHRLSYTWHTFTAEWAEVSDFDADTCARLAAEPRSRATFELSEQDGVTRLTVIHDRFEPGSEVLAGITNGWPPILAGLKSLLETGEPLTSNDS